MKKVLLSITAASCVIVLNAQSIVPSEGADMIVLNAKITTQHLSQPAASALAVRDGRIYAVGSDAEILNLKNASTKIVDAEGKTIDPRHKTILTHMSSMKKPAIII